MADELKETTGGNGTGEASPGATPAPTIKATVTLVLYDTGGVSISANLPPNGVLHMLAQGVHAVVQQLEEQAKEQAHGSSIVRPGFRDRVGRHLHLKRH
jgi:hypothetical protein